MEATQHLILADMLMLSSQADEIIDDYELNLPPLNVKTYDIWRLGLNNISPSTPLGKVLNNILNSYDEYYRRI